MKRQRQNELPRFTVGALAIAGASAASGATVQITLAGNKIATTGGNQLVADLTGDGFNDVTLGEFGYGTGRAGVRVNGVRLYAGAQPADYGMIFHSARANFVAGALGTARRDTYDRNVSISYLNPVTFTDSRINGGAATDGYLQVNAFNTSATDHTVELSRLIFDDASTTRPAFTSIPGTLAEFGSAVPEPSSLGLLALGAGGLLLRRSRAKAA